MGQTIRRVSGSSPLSGGPDGTDPPPAASIGRYLTQQRKLRGMELDEVVAITRIPRRSLERLENGAFDGLSDGFVRGFVRTVAIAIGLDPDETVARLLVEPELGTRNRWPRAGAVIGLAVGVSLLLTIAAVVVGSLGSPGPSAESARPVAAESQLLRRDPVKALAEEQTATRPR